ncbi:uncharacterized protein N0V89_008125 [Didymosphaeria variabile]|uniref:Uncharacterized protein n=1 Tax=Didymosphaeria variabile TaxID=1932322 RepID=A0A9W8XF59_9PLEO|nr:uncharacterized protein N0V89_008125 [Didymosphaeria variabile]KAJ4349509.1 hypothetical protein N0V89_008125 [Didymosphaeria variabile]
MGFAELPKELLQAILNHAISVRGMKRGLRLRLLNKRFAAEVIDTIYTYRMLDTRFAKRLYAQIPPMPPFTASYLEYRIHNAEDGVAPYPRLGFLRKIARDVVAENESLEYDACVQLLCRLISEGGEPRVYQVFCPALSLPTTFYEGDGDYFDTLFATAVVTNTTPIVERYMGSYRYGGFKALFAPSEYEFYRLAARYADTATLALFLSTRYSYRVDIRRRNEMLVAAAAVGRLSAFRLIHGSRIEEAPWDFEGREKVFDDALGTPSLDVWHEVIRLRATYGSPSVISEDRKTKLLADCVGEGPSWDTLSGRMPQVL